MPSSASDEGPARGAMRVHRFRPRDAFFWPLPEQVLRELAKKNAEKAYRTLQYMQQEMLEARLLYEQSRTLGRNYRLCQRLYTIWRAV